MTEITNTQDIIDSYEVTERIQELREEWAEATGDDPSDYTLTEDDWAVGLGYDGAREIVALMELESEGAAATPDWPYGATLIHEDYFTTYAQEMAEDIGAIDRDAGWPYQYIDWDRAADALKMDYMPVEFDGQTYYVR